MSNLCREQDTRARMKAYDLNAIRERFEPLSGRANEALGLFDDCFLGIGRYIPGCSPWERHPNGDELLLVTDGQIDIEVLEDDGASHRVHIAEGALFVVPRGKWHQLTATDNVNIVFASPSEAGVERMRDHPFRK